jgi:hypothetical protein
MATPLIPQEIYLLERYCSLEYYAEMLDAWAKMVAVAEVQTDKLTKPWNERSPSAIVAACPRKIFHR